MWFKFSRIVFAYVLGFENLLNFVNSNPLIMDKHNSPRMHDTSCLILVQLSLYSLLHHAAPMDFIALSVSILIASSPARICRNVTIVDDSVVENQQEVFLLTLNTTDVRIVFDRATASVVIQDNDGEIKIANRSLITYKMFATYRQVKRTIS